MGMKIFKQLSDGFSALRRRDQVIAVVAVALVFGLGGNLLLLKPQSIVIDSLRAKERVVAIELAETKKALVAITSLEEKGIDPLAAERATLAELQGEIAKTNDYLSGHDNAAASQVSILVRGLIKNNPGLTLVSLKTRPGVVFYTPPAPPPPPKQSGLQTEVEKALAKLKKEEAPKAAPAVTLVNKPLYKHGVDVSVRGSYPALIAYLEDMQKLPQRIFWSEASLDAANHREVTLKLVVFTLSDQPTSLLN